MRLLVTLVLAFTFHLGVYAQTSKEEQLAALLAQAAALLAEIEAERESEADAQPAVSQQCSRSNVEACDADQLCLLATFGEPKQWKRGAMGVYVRESERRGLTCGVVERATTTTESSSSSISQCTLSDVSACSTEQLCARGTTGMPKQWRTNGSRLPYAEEAKRRGLTCGVVDLVAQCTPSNVSVCSAALVCSRGTYGDPKRWFTSGSASRYSLEAIRRGLACGVVERATTVSSGTDSSNGQCSAANPRACTVQHVCRFVAYDNKFADEALRRGITCGVSERAATSTSSNRARNRCTLSDVSACSTEQLCARGTFGTPLRWYERSSASVYADEAKRRGQTCGVVERPTTTTESSSGSSNQCSSANPRACRSQYVCIFAANGKPKRWATDGIGLTYADEAKRRGLTCGVVERAATTSSQCSLNNVRACSTALVCARGTYGTPKQWRTSGSWSAYADEAKRRGLTCGVVEQPTSNSISSISQCTLSDVSACSTEQLCARGTTGMPKQWRTNGSRLPYAEEAQRRGLTCGVGERSTTTTASSSSSNQCSLTNVRACSSENLCERATYGTPLRWYERSNLSGFSNEAKRRGLTCGVGGQSSFNAQCSPTNARACRDQTLCDRATTGTPSTWRTNGVWREYSNEAKRRGLTCGVIERAGTTSSTSSSNQCSTTNARACTVEQLCERATYGNPKRWFTGRHETEAKRRGLTCGVATSPRSSSSSSSTQRTTTRSASSYGEHGPACASYGFTPGTDGFSACIQRETLEAQEEARRQVADRAAEERQRRERVRGALGQFFRDLGQTNRNTYTPSYRRDPSYTCRNNGFGTVRCNPY